MGQAIDGPYFQTHFDGDEDKGFRTLQGAMAYAEGLPSPTGKILYIPDEAATLAKVMIVYTDGKIEEGSHQLMKIELDP
ncbi:MAG: hypothetical protein ACOYEV_14690 [Candidatus Nanopelagicales bacterium]